MSDVDASLPSGEEAVAAPPPSVGEQLAAARLARGLSVADVGQTLKLGARQVEALEKGDWQALPGTTFIRGFVRNYARLLGLDSAPLMAMLDTVLAKPAATLAVPRSPQGAMPRAGEGGTRRDRFVVIAGAALVLLAALAYFLMPGDLSGLRDSAQHLLDSLARHEEPAAEPVEPAFPPGATAQQIMNPQAVEEGTSTPGTPAPAEPPSPAPAAAAPASPAAAPAGSVQLRLVADKDSWVEVRDRDNKVLLLAEPMLAGREQTLAGIPPLSVVLGYAAGVRLTWRGKAVDLSSYTKGDVARLTLE
jgi:cytoskeleton protein RodZ